MWNPKSGQRSGEEVAAWLHAFRARRALPYLSSLCLCAQGSPRPQRGVQNPPAGMTSLTPPCRLQGASTICRHLHLEGGGSVATGNSGFLKSSQGIWNFIIRSLQSSRHPGVGSVFSAFCVFFFVFFFRKQNIFPSKQRLSVTFGLFIASLAELNLQAVQRAF